MNKNKSTIASLNCMKTAVAYFHTAIALSTQFSIVSSNIIGLTQNNDENASQVFSKQPTEELLTILVNTSSSSATSNIFENTTQTNLEESKKIHKIKQPIKHQKMQKTMHRKLQQVITQQQQIKITDLITEMHYFYCRLCCVNAIHCG